MGTEEDQKRFYDLLWPHLAAVVRLAQVLCGGDETEAEDLAQETMLKAFRAIERFQPDTDAKAWLLAILRNTRIDRLRAAAADVDCLSLDELAQEPADVETTSAVDEQAIRENPQVVLEQFSDREMIQALQNLPEEIRWTLLLVDVEQMEHKEAAQVLGVPVGTIKSRAHRGRAILKVTLLAEARQDRI